ncbi:MAG: glycosyltransferase [Acutalibacteraceae bacterium]|nr:glycosyltransferase [Acutalibacteraceae bacterium]
MPERILVYGMTDNPGGIETYLINQLRALNPDKAVFDFVTDFPSMAYADEAEKLGAMIYYIPAKSKGVFSQWKAFAKILKAHPEYKKVYFNALDAGVALTEFVPWLFGRTIITHSHNGSTDKAKLHKFCKPLLNFFTSKRFACSKIAADYMFGNREVKIIPNMIDAEKYAYSPEIRQKKREELGIENNFVVCHIGRLSNQKNPMGLIDIFESVYKSDNSAVLLSVGSGEMENEVHSYASQKKANGSIRFLGRRSDISEILQAADVFVLPSFYEGLPIVAIESQAAGLPCILSENISTEVAITDNAYFLSLDAPISVWTEKILSFKNFNRTSKTSELAAGGYDYNRPSAAQIELLNYFEDEG